MPGSGRKFYDGEVCTVPARGFRLGGPAKTLLTGGFSSPHQMQVGPVETIGMSNVQGRVLDFSASKIAATQVQLATGLVKY